jgi:hypothetical protein
MFIQISFCHTIGETDHGIAKTIIFFLWSELRETSLQRHPNEVKDGLVIRGEEALLMVGVSPTIEKSS